MGNLSLDTQQINFFQSIERRFRGILIRVHPNWLIFDSQCILYDYASQFANNKSEWGVSRKRLSQFWSPFIRSYIDKPIRMLSNWIRVISSIGLFVGAGVCEIGGGWFVWKFRKEGWHWIFFILGSFALVLYGLIPTFQSQPFGRTYAAYGGFFIGLSLLWGWVFDSQQPDRWDLICAAIAVGAVIVMISVPRNPEAGTYQPAVLSFKDQDFTWGYLDLRDQGLG